MLRILPLLLLALPSAAADVARKDLKPGLVAAFTEFTERPTTSTMRRIEPTVAFLEKPGESLHPTHSRTTRATWTGYLQIVTPGDYTFSANTNGGVASLTLQGRGDAAALNEQVVLNGDDPQPRQLLAHKLDAGFYFFQAVYTVPRAAEAKDPNHRFELLWQGPGFPREPIPYFFFGHLPTQRPENFAADARHDQGRFLFEEMACAKCHAPVKDASLAERSGPNLTKIGSRAFAGWLDAWLADPSKLRPHTTMPKMFDSTDQGVAERYAVVQYLTSLGGPLLEVRLPLFEKINAKSLENGAALFTSTGCAACHGPQLAGTMKRNDDDDDEPPFEPLDSLYGFGGHPQGRYALGGLGSKTTADELAKYLRDPLTTNPHGRMPAMNLSGDEARDLARHLVRFTDEGITNKAGVAAPKLTPAQLSEQVFKSELAQGTPQEQWKQLGQKLFSSKGCANCHAIDGEKNPSDASKKRGRDLTLLRSAANQGCLSDTPAPVVYNLDAAQRTALRDFVKRESHHPAPAYQARAALKRFNCLNCHSRDGEGGLGNELADRMKKLEAAGANEDDVRPPRLTGIGHKATTAWLTDVLLKGGRARPWSSLRMPQYGKANVGHLPVSLAASEAVLPDTTAPKSKTAIALLENGRKLAGKEGLGCVACHDISGIAGGGTRGPDLALTDRRVRREWYGRWMHNPQRLAPGTKMPQNFTDGVSVSKLLSANADAQIEALWSYFALGPGLPLPAGLEPPSKALALIVKDRPELLRTFLPYGAGTRPFAVGYPGGGSYAFDSHANRVVYAWEGNFLDVKPVWDFRGGNQAKLLGPKFFTPPPGQPWALTPSGTPPDFLKQAEDYAYGAPVPFQKNFTGPMRTHFSGYTLDPAGRPTFQYRVDDPVGEASVSVSDTPVPVRASIASGLQRTMSLDASKLKDRTLWLHVASTTGKPRPIPGGVVLPQADDRALVVKLTTAPKGTTWHFLGRDAVLKIPAAGKQELGYTVWSLPRDDDALLSAIEPK